MKKTFIILVLIFICPVVYSANEIQAFAPGVTTAYYVVRGLSGTVWYPVGLVMETWGTAARTAADYDLALTNKSGGMWVGNFDTNIAAGYYHIATHYQSGGAPANADPVVWVEYGYWDGTLWNKTALYSDVNDIAGGLPSADTIADSVWDELMAGHTGETTFGGELQTLDPNITLILADTSELQTDWTNGGRLDLLIDAIKYKTDLISLVDTVVKEANDTNNFTIENGTDVNDAYWFMAIIVEDAGGNLSKEIRWIDQYDENSGDPNVWVDEGFSFTPAVGDVVHIMGTCYGGYLYDIMNNLDETRGVLNVVDRTGTGGAYRAGAIRIDALGNDP